MAATELAEIGYVVKTHGVKGHLRISFGDHTKELSKGEALFFLVKGEKVPYFIGEIEYIKDNEAFVLLEDVNAIEPASRFSKKTVWGRSNLLEVVDESEGAPDYTGFLIIDEDRGEIGVIQAFYEMSDYDLLEVLYLEREVLIPFHEETVLEVDETKKTITMKLPDGILDI